MQLAGVHHITVAPALLRELAATKPGDDTPAAKAHSLFDDASAAHAPVPPKLSYLHDESGYRMAVMRAGKGREEGKLNYVSQSFFFFVGWEEEGKENRMLTVLASSLEQAINTFCDMQIALEKALKAEIAAL